MCSQSSLLFRIGRHCAVNRVYIQQQFVIVSGVPILLDGYVERNTGTLFGELRRQQPHYNTQSSYKTIELRIRILNFEKEN